MFKKEEKLMLRDEMNLREIREMITFLKESNVKTFEGMGISVEFNMEMDEQPQVIPQFRDPVDQDTMVNSHFRS
tara:strand:+ start:1015 stop:1236 length:222 start_codon:yes stop_codon:yes gene_type:complete